MMEYSKGIGKNTPILHGVYAIVMALVTFMPCRAQAQTKISLSPTAATRKPTLNELYAMFFTYCVQVETVADADEKLGKDRSFYRSHLQRASGLTEAEYTQVLLSAHRFIAIEKNENDRLSNLNGANAPQGLSPSILLRPKMSGDKTGLVVPSNLSATTLQGEISELRQILGTERADLLDTYLQQDYALHKIGSTSSRAIVTTEVSAPPTSISPDTIPIDGGTTCANFTDSEGDPFSICVDSQMSYLENGAIQLYSAGSWSYNNFPAGEFDGASFVGTLLMNNQVTQTSCTEPVGGPCTVNLEGITVNAPYTWVTTGSFAYFDGCNGPCIARHGDPRPPSVTINSPVLSSLSKTSFTQNDSGTFNIVGKYLTSPFQNVPSISVTDNSNTFGTFSLNNYNLDGTGITVAYGVLPNAATGTQYVGVYNGFIGGGDGEGGQITINPAVPVIDTITVVGSPLNQLQAGPNTQTITLTGRNFGTTPPTITIATGGAGVTIVTGSIIEPSLRAQPNKSPTQHSAKQLKQAPSPSATADTEQSVSFQVNIASSAVAGSVTFLLSANDGQTETTISPPLIIEPEQPTSPIILDGSANSNNGTCSGENIGQGAASAQQIVIGQIVSFTACVPNADFGGWGTPYNVSATWAPTNSFTQSSAVANYLLSTVVTNPSAKLGNPQVFKNAAVVPINPSLNCESSIAFCDFQSFYFVTPGTYDFTFSYQLNNGADSMAATVEYIVAGPTSGSSNCLGGGQSCAFYQYAGSPKIQVFGAGQLNGNTVSVLIAGNPNVAGASALDVLVSATPPASTVGSFQWVNKIVSRNTQYLYPENIVCTNCTFANQLDNVYPYAVQPSSTNEAIDNPSINLTFPGATLYEVNDRFNAQMYLMWDPSLNVDGSSSPGCAASNVYGPNGQQVVVKFSTCTGSIPVPLGSLLWGYCGGAINTLNPQPATWVLSCPENGTPDVSPVYLPSNGSSSYPLWSSVYYNNN